jgi:hypothetical protein
MNVFDQHGRVRHDIDQREIEKLSPVQRDALLAMIDTALKAEAAEDGFRDAEVATGAAGRDAALKTTAFNQAVPQRTFLQEHRAAIRARQGLPPEEAVIEPKVLKRAEAAAKAADAANATLEKCRADEITAKGYRGECRLAFATKAKVWSTVDGAPKTTADLVRINSKAEIERKRAVADGRLPPDAVDPVYHQEQIDRVMAGGARGSSADLGYRRQPGRLPKLPSER